MAGQNEETIDPKEFNIEVYMYCRQCLKELPVGMEPGQYARVEVGWTSWGMQVWCRRHNTNILHVNFQGQQHPAEMGANLFNKPRMV